MKRLSVFLTVLCLMAPAAAFGQVVDMEGSFLEPLQQVLVHLLCLVDHPPLLSEDVDCND